MFFVFVLFASVFLFFLSFAASLPLSSSSYYLYFSSSSFLFFSFFLFSLATLLIEINRSFSAPKGTQVTFWDSWRGGKWAGSG